MPACAGMTKEAISKQNFAASNNRSARRRSISRRGTLIAATIAPASPLLPILPRAPAFPSSPPGGVLYHAPHRRPLQDVLTCIREKCTIDEAGLRLEANAERHIKSRQGDGAPVQRP